MVVYWLNTFTLTRGAFLRFSRLWRNRSRFAKSIRTQKKLRTLKRLGTSWVCLLFPGLYLRQVGGLDDHVEARLEEGV